MSVDSGSIWKNQDGCWCRTCPECKGIAIHRGNRAMHNAHNRYLHKMSCGECRKKHISEKLKGPKSPMFGTHLSEKTIRKLVELNTGCNNPRFGKHHSEAHKQRLSENSRGAKCHCFGKKMGDDFKRKCRIRTLERFNKLGIASCVDDGAEEWFNKLINNGHKIIQNFHLSDVGYVVDGYDPDKHIIIEYDTSYHFTLKQQRKDLVRQNNIIKHYEEIHNPLNMFLRVRVMKNRPEEMNVVYYGPSNSTGTPIPYSTDIVKKQIIHG